ncbi:hypothetical protein D3C76_445540 [compost metagenome]
MVRLNILQSRPMMKPATAMCLLPKIHIIVIDYQVLPQRLCIRPGPMMRLKM